MRAADGSEEGGGARAWDVIGIGENSVDLVYRLPALPQPNGSLAKLPILAHATEYGGQVATTLGTCAALGLSTAYVGAFGGDAAGTGIRGELTRRGVDVGLARVRPAANRYAVILVDEHSGERLILWHRDPRLRLAESDLPVDAIRRARVLHVDAVDEDVAIRAARIGREAGIIVTCDVDRVTARTPELIAAVTTPILAAGVAEALTGEADDERALRAMRRDHGGLLCVTLGERGALALDGDRLHRVAGFRVDVVDSTGAGDVFRGAFIDALLRNEPVDDILRFANAAAAVSCTRHGAMGGVPRRDEIAAVMRR